MPNLSPVGSFLEGLSGGMAQRRTMDRDASDRELQDRRIRLAEEEAARARSNDEYNRSLTERKMKYLDEDRAKESADYDRRMREHEADRAYQDRERAYQDRERAANAPVLDAERKARLGEATATNSDREFVSNTGAQARRDYDAEMGKSILSSGGKFSVDGREYSTRQEAERAYEGGHGSFADRYNEMIAPKMRDHYIQTGDTQRAAAWDKWVSDARVKRGMDIGGRLLNAYHDNDWDGVARHFTALAKDDSYWATDGMDLKAEPIVKDGRTNGIRVTYKNKSTGDVTVKNIEGDMSQIAGQIGAITNPSAVFESNIKQLSDARAAQAKMREKGIDTSFEIAKQSAKSDDDLRAGILKDLTSDLKFSQMSPAEKRAEYEFRYSLARRREAAQSPLQGGAPAQSGATPAPQQARRTVPIYDGESGAVVPAGATVVREPGEPPRVVERPGSVSAYEKRLGLDRAAAWEQPLEKPIPSPSQPTRPYSGGEGVDDYEQRLGLVAPRPARNYGVVVVPQKKNRSLADFERELGLADKKAAGR